MLRKYNTTGHFRLLNQVRSELKDNPLVRPQDGQTVAEVNRSRALIRATEGRSASTQRSARRSTSSRDERSLERSASSQAAAYTRSEAEPHHETFTVVPVISELDDAGVNGFRDRLNAIDLR